MGGIVKSWTSRSLYKIDILLAHLSYIWEAENIIFAVESRAEVGINFIIDQMSSCQEIHTPLWFPGADWSLTVQSVLHLKLGVLLEI